MKTIFDLSLAIISLGTLVLFVTTRVKLQFGLKDKAVVWASVLIGGALGVVLATGGLLDMAQLPRYPVWLSGLIVGLLAGYGASGGKDTLDGFQMNMAELRAQAALKYGCAPDLPASPAPQAPQPSPSNALPPDAVGDDWVTTDLSALRRE